jgi:hypothetical protein
MCGVFPRAADASGRDQRRPGVSLSGGAGWSTRFARVFVNLPTPFSPNLKLRHRGHHVRPRHHQGHEPWGDLNG